MHEALATGVVVSYYKKRIKNLARIACGMLACEQIERVVIWNNGGDDTQPLINKELSQFPGELQECMFVLNSNRNVSLFGRYLACQSEFVETSLIATCDDDVLVSAPMWDNLYAEVIRTGKICCYLDEGHFRLHTRGNYRHEHKRGTAHETLLGYGSMFPVRSCEVLTRYIEARGVDTLLERKADRLFTILQNEPHCVFKTSVKHMPGAMDRESYYRQRDHVKLNEQAYRVAVRLLNKWGDHDEKH